MPFPLYETLPAMLHMHKPEWLESDCIKAVLRGERLKQVREQRGLSQRELGLQVGIQHGMIYRYENNLSDPTSATLTIIADKLRVSMDFLVGLSNDPGTHLDPTGLSEEEQQMVDAFRREGWPGVLHLGVDRLAGKGRT